MSFCLIMYSYSKTLHFMRLYWHVFSFEYFDFVAIHINYNEFILKLYNAKKNKRILLTLIKIVSNILKAMKNIVPN